MKELRLGGSVVKKLTESVPTDKPVLVFTDRFFTSVKLLDRLLQKHVYLTGTTMANRTEGIAATFPKDKEMSRGSSVENVREDETACIVKWKDNKSVLLLSSAVGTEPECNCKRWSKEKQKKLEIKQPALVRFYNENMSGVDLMDRYLSYCRIAT